MSDLTVDGGVRFRLRNGQIGDVKEILQIYHGFFPNTQKTEELWFITITGCSDWMAA